MDGMYMNKRIILISLIVGIFQLLNACMPKAETKKSTNETFDKTSNWIVLNKTNATKKGNIYSWDIEVKHPIVYVVQVLFTNKLPENSKPAIVKVDEQELVAPFNNTYITYKNQIVSEFNKTIKFSKTGKHGITIETEADFEQIRLVPHFKNPIGSGKYDVEWLEMHQSPEKQASLNWFKEAKFGMFIHWGLYSDAGGVWKGVQINDSPYPGPKVAEWLMHAFRIPRDEYRNLAKTFNPDKSFAQNIAKLAKDAGMKYIVITSKHHDGFALFDSECSEYNMVDATPYHADAIKELYEACLKEGLDFGVYYSHGNDWMDGTDGNYSNVKKENDSLGVFTHPMGKNLWDPSPNTHSEYIKAKAIPQIKELIQLLPELKLIWFDGEGFITENQSFEFYKMVYQLNPNILVNRRVGWGFGDYEDAGDNKIPSADEVLNKYWETCGTTNNSWGYKSYDQDWKSPKETLYYIVDIASKGGNYLLNIGPDGNGHVPNESQNILRTVGEWMRINGEAIYGTKKWEKISEGQKETLLEGTGHRATKGFNKTFAPTDFWFTSNNEHIYAISLVKATGTITIHAFKKEIGDITEVKILGNDKDFKWKQTETGLELNLEGINSNENGFVVKVSLSK